MRTRLVARNGLRAAVLLAIAGSTTRAASTAVTLRVGDAAPALQVTGWAKGTPVAAFEPGKVYVMEFWATWCGPCKKAIPHLTGLAHQYAGRATFTDVDVWEHTKEGTDAAIDAKVKPFVASIGEKMDYNVAIDGAAGKMADTWLEPAGQEGIPATFVIDGGGEIAWIGHPMELEPVLEKVVAGTWDAAAERSRADAVIAFEAPRKAAYKAIMQAYRTKDYPGVLAACDAAEKAVPALANDGNLVSYRAMALFNSDAAAAVAYVRARTGPGGPTTRPADAAVFVRVVPNVPATAPMTPRDWKAVVAALDPLISKAAGGSSLLSDYADLMERAGERDLALFYLNKSVNMTIAENAKRDDPDHAEYYAQQLKKRQDRLTALTGKAGLSAADR